MTTAYFPISIFKDSKIPPEPLKNFLSYVNQKAQNVIWPQIFFSSPRVIAHNVKQSIVIYFIPRATKNMHIILIKKGSMY